MTSIKEKILTVFIRNRIIYSASMIWRLLKSNATPENTRIVILENAMLDKSILKSIEVEPGFNMITDDLIAFTGLSKQQVCERLLRNPATHFKSEFRWHSPKDYNELAWFYRCSYGYLFANSAHSYWTKLDFLNPEIGSILDYGAGVGNNAICLAKRGFNVDYFEINIIEEAFTRYRANHRGLNNISFISPYVDGKFDPIKCIANTYGAIILQDVLEHIPNYNVLLSHLIDHLDSGGYIIENSPFEELSQEIDIHLKPSIPIEVAMKGMQRIETGIWKKIA